MDTTVAGQTHPCGKQRHHGIAFPPQPAQHKANTYCLTKAWVRTQFYGQGAILDASKHYLVHTRSSSEPRGPPLVTTLSRTQIHTHMHVISICTLSKEQGVAEVL